MTHNEVVRIGPALGWGIVIYSTLYLTWSGLVLYGFADTVIGRIALLIALVTVVTIAGRELRLQAWEDIVPYSLSWVLIMVVLDILISARINGMDIFSDANLWIDYALVGSVPLLAPKTRARAHTHVHIT